MMWRSLSDRPTQARNTFAMPSQDDTVLELLQDGAMFTIGSESQYPDWERMWKNELSKDDSQKPKGLYASGIRIM